MPDHRLEAVFQRGIGPWGTRIVAEIEGLFGLRP